MIKSAVEALRQVGSSFKLEPFGIIIQPIIEDVLAEHKKDKYRKGTILTPLIMVWLVLTLTLRRDVNYPKTLNWLVSGLRWLCLDMPAKLVKDGAISHARVKLGVAVFRDIFYKFVQSFTSINPDFYGWVTVMFDGTAMTMPDTKSNREKFGKPKSNRGSGAFPQIRAVALLMLSARRIFDVAYAPFSGKKTGERTLMLKILKKIKRKDFLFLFDAGFYSFFSCLVHERKWAQFYHESQQIRLFIGRFRVLLKKGASNPCPTILNLIPMFKNTARGSSGWGIGILFNGSKKLWNYVEKKTKKIRDFWSY